MTTTRMKGVEVGLIETSNGFFFGIICSAVASFSLIAAALWFWGAKEVRGNFNEVLFLTAIGAGWLFAIHALFPWLGLSLRDDAVERKNCAALIAFASALLASAITFAAGNLGEGPSYSENILCAALSTGGLLGLWVTFELGAHVSISIAEERDPASGIRFGGLLLAWSLILGRAVTGNWHSCADSIQDLFHDGWRAGVICLVALVAELFLKPNRLRPFPSWPVYGLVPALFYLGMAIAWVWHLGKWEGMPA